MPAAGRFSAGAFYFRKENFGEALAKGAFYFRKENFGGALAKGALLRYNRKKNGEIPT